MLTGVAPFTGPSPAEILRHVVEDEPATPRSLRRKIPRDLETICLKCLRKQPNQRYGTAEALAEDLRRFRLGEPIEARTVGSIERLWSWCRRKPALAAASGALIAPIFKLDPMMGGQPLLKAFIIILGGLGSIPGAILGGLMLGLIDSTVATALGAEPAFLLSFVFIILLLLFRPAGLFGHAPA